MELSEVKLFGVRSGQSTKEWKVESGRDGKEKGNVVRAGVIKGDECQ